MAAICAIWLFFAVSCQLRYRYSWSSIIFAAISINFSHVKAQIAAECRTQRQDTSMAQLQMLQEMLSCRPSRCTENLLSHCPTNPKFTPGKPWILCHPPDFLRFEHVLKFLGNFILAYFGSDGSELSAPRTGYGCCQWAHCASCAACACGFCTRGAQQGKLWLGAEMFQKTSNWRWWRHGPWA